MADCFRWCALIGGLLSRNRPTALHQWHIPLAIGLIASISSKY